MSNIFWSMFRRFVFSDIPKGGVDVFAFNSTVCQTLLRLQESNSSLIAQLFWVGYRRAFVPYERRKRQKGKSSWTFMRKGRYLLDSVISFSDLPLQIILWLGMLGIAFSSILGCVIFFSRIFGLITVPGYTVIVLAILFSISLFLFLNGMLGLYLWRIFENTKKRPLSVVSNTRDFDKE